MRLNKTATCIKCGEKDGLSLSFTGRQRGSEGKKRRSLKDQDKMLLLVPVCVCVRVCEEM